VSRDRRTISIKDLSKNIVNIEWNVDRTEYGGNDVTAQSIASYHRLGEGKE